MAAILEGPGVMDGRHKRGRRQGAHAFDPRQPLTHVGLRGQLGDPRVVAGDLGIQGTYPLIHIPEQLPTEVAQSIVCIFHNQRDRLPYAANALGHHQSILPQHPAELVGQGRAHFDTVLSDAMQRLHILIRRAIDRHWTHPGAAGRFTNPLGIAAVRLLPCTYGFTACGAMSFTVCPSLVISRAQ